MRYVAAFLPGSVPRLRFASREHCYFAMELLGGELANLKAELLAGRIERRQAAMAGQTLGRIHRHSAGDSEAMQRFDTTDDFWQLRIEPYLLATAEVHPRLAAAASAEAERLAACRVALVHGDYSPKNLFVSGDRLVVIDCEVAWYGDPAFDLAFLLNHYCLKALYHAPDPPQAAVRRRSSGGRGVQRSVVEFAGGSRYRRPRESIAADAALGSRGWQVAGRISFGLAAAMRPAVCRGENTRSAAGFGRNAGELVCLDRSTRGGGMKIVGVSAFPIFDSRGVPTLEAEVTLENGTRGHGLVPSGASTGQFEAVELRDGDATRWRGKSVHRAIENVDREIAPAIIGHDSRDQAGIDQRMIELDGTANKSRLGANAILGVSMAVADAAAKAVGVPLFEYLGGGNGVLLPLPEIQMIGGGAHANWRTDVQDFLLIATGARSYDEALEISHNVYHAAGDLLKRQGKYHGVADEGGYWPEFESHEAVFEFLLRVDRSRRIHAGPASGTGSRPRRQRFLRFGHRSLPSAVGKPHADHRANDRTGLRLVPTLSDRVASRIRSRIPTCEGWRQLNAALGNRVQLVGDDLFTTNPARIRQGIADGLANAVLIKLNQIGTVTETLEAIRLTQQAGWRPIISARSGETEDASDRPFGCGDERRPTQSRLVQPLGTNGEMERSAADFARSRRPSSLFSPPSRPTRMARSHGRRIGLPPSAVAHEIQAGEITRQADKPPRSIG